MEGSFVSVFGLGQFSACLAYGSRDVCSYVRVCTCSSPTLSPPAISVFSPVVVIVNQSNQKAHIQIYDNKMIAQR